MNKQSIAVKRIVCSLFFLFCAGSLWAAPNYITLQGILKNTAGQPVSGPVDMSIRILDGPDPDTAAEEYAEEHLGIMLTDGVYNLILGNGTGHSGVFDSTLFYADNRFLQIGIRKAPDLDYELLTPLQPFNSVAYALNADSVDGLDSTDLLSSHGGTITGDMTVNGNVTIDNGTQGSGKVLVSDDFGTANWNLLTIDDLSDASHTDGNSIFFGINAGLNDDGNINWNTGVGYLALEENTSGKRNTAIGHTSLRRNVEGGNSNTAIGSSTLSYNTTGSNNTAIGTSALLSNTTGRDNTASGSVALFSNKTGEFNTANGVSALYHNVDGDRNVAIGYKSLYFHTTGWGNVAVGNSAGWNNGSGIKNTIIGSSAGSETASNSQSGNVFIGYGAGTLETGSNKLHITNSPLAPPLIYGDFTAGSEMIKVNGDFETTGQIKIAGGNPGAEKVLTSDADGLATWETSVANAVHAETATSAGDADTIDGMDSTALDQSAHVGEMTNPHDVTAAQIQAVEVSAFTTHSENPSAHHTKTSNFTELNGEATDAQIPNNITINYAAAAGTSTTAATATNANNADTLDGIDSAAFVASGGDTMTGTLTLPLDGLKVGTKQLILSGGNVGIDDSTPDFRLDVNGDINTTGVLRMDGYRILKVEEWTHNTFLGYEAGVNTLSSENNTFIGYGAGKSNGYGENNTYVGYSAGHLSSGSNNVFIGHMAGYNESGNHKLYIENNSFASPLIGGDFLWNTLVFNANVGINTEAETDRQLNVLGSTSDKYGAYIETNDSNSSAFALYGVADGSTDRGSEDLHFGLYGVAKNAWKNYGVVGNAIDSEANTNYGVYGYASGGTAYAGYFDGTLAYTGSLLNASDIRLKENILPLEDALTKLQNIEGVSYSLKESPEQKRIGVIAQDVQHVLPEAVSVIDSENGYLGVNYTSLIPLLIEAVKELKEQNDALKSLLCQKYETEDICEK